MSDVLRDIASYSAYVYAQADRHPFITDSKLTLKPIGATLAELEGRVECREGLYLEAWELVDFNERRIRNYSYEVYKGGKIGWFDAWEHPEISSGRHFSPSPAHFTRPTEQPGARAGDQFFRTQFGHGFE